MASINYRLVPAATVEQQGADVAAAIAYLLKNAEKFGIDLNRVVVMGHSAGARRLRVGPMPAHAGSWVTKRGRWDYTAGDASIV